MIEERLKKASRSPYRSKKSASNYLDLNENDTSEIDFNVVFANLNLLSLLL